MKDIEKGVTDNRLHTEGVPGKACVCVCVCVCARVGGAACRGVGEIAVVCV